MGFFGLMINILLCCLDLVKALFACEKCVLFPQLLLFCARGREGFGYTYICMRMLYNKYVCSFFVISFYGKTICCSLHVTN